jgi:hypothetical protein
MEAVSADRSIGLSVTRLGGSDPCRSDRECKMEQVEAFLPSLGGRELRVYIYAKTERNNLYK